MITTKLIILVALIMVIIVGYIIALARLSSNKHLTITLSIVISLIGIAAAVGLFFFLRTNSEGISKYQWIQMLTTHFNMNEYHGESPYYSDVDTDDPYYASVQSAYEWGVIEDKSSFNGDKNITGEYAALTAMKAVGAYKVKIYLGLSETPEKEDYLSLAVDKGVISKNQLRQLLSEAEAQNVLERAWDLYYSELWVDDYVDIQYTDSVREIDDADIVSFNPNENRIILSGNAASKLDAGNIIILADPHNGAKMSKRIVSINADGEVELEDASLDDTFEHLVISDTVEVTSDELFEGIVNAYGGDITETARNENYGLLLTKDELKEYRHDGVEIDVVINADSTSLTFKNYQSNESFTKEVPGVSLKNARSFDGGFRNNKITAKGGDKIEVDVDIKNVYFGVQTDYAPFVGCNYFAAQTEMDVTTAFMAGGNAELEIPLTPTPITIVGVDGWLAINFEIKLVVSIDGSIGIVVETKPRECFEYHKGAGVHYINNTPHPSVEADIEADFEGEIEIEPSFEVLFNKIVDLEFDVGAGAEAKVTMRSNSDIKSCIDVKAYAPTLSYGWLNDEESQLRALVPAKEVTIWDSDNAPYIKDFHFEWYGGNDLRNPSECTYNKKTTINVNPREGNDRDIDGKEEGFNGERFVVFSRKADGTCTGSISDLISFDDATIKKASIGDSIISSNGTGDTFTLVSETDVDEYYGYGPSVDVLGLTSDQGGNSYAYTGLGIKTDGGDMYYLDDDGDGYYAVDELSGTWVSYNSDDFTFEMDDSVEVDIGLCSFSDDYSDDNSEFIISGSEFMKIPSNPSGNYDWNEGTYEYKGRMVIKPDDNIMAYAHFDDGILTRIRILPNPDLVN